MSDAVLVTGASGFIGRKLVEALQAADITAVRHTRAEGDIVTADFPHRDIRHVYHLAAETKVPESWKRTADFYRTNILGTVNVLEFCRRTGASLTLSSSYVYGPPEYLPISEQHPVQAFNPYSHTKLVAEDICRYYSRQFSVAVTVIRPFNVYGPGQDVHFLIPKLVKQAADPDCRAFSVLDARPKRDYVYIDDLIALFVKTGSCAGFRVYNAGSGRSYSINDIVGILNSFRPEPLPLLDAGEERPSEIMDVVADIQAALNVGWQPVVSIEEGLRRMYAHEAAKHTRSTS